MSSRLLGTAAAVSALGLFAASFAPWFAHEGLDGPEGDRLRDDDTLILTLSGWELEGRIAALVLLAVFLGLGAGIWSIRRPRDPRLPLACVVTAFGGLAAAWAIGSELRSPSEEIYNDARVWARLALVAAIVTAIAAGAAGVAALSRKEDSRPGGPAWPLFGGAAALYLLALGANATEIWQPQFVAACCAAAVLGFLVPRWWLALLPLVLVVLVLELTGSGCDAASSECESLTEVLYAFIAVFVSGALLIGIGTRLLRRRLRQQQV